MYTTKKFTDYYADPEFKKKHLNYVMTKVNCECGGRYMRSNKSNHYLTSKHILNLRLKQAEELIKQVNK